MKTVKILSTAMLIAASATASAWSNEPTANPDQFGMPAYAAPTMTEEQRAALIEQHKAFIEQQQKAFEQMQASQRQQFEQFNSDPFANADAEFKSMQESMQAQRAQMLEEMNRFAPAERELPEHIAKRIEESEAQRAEMLKKMEERRAEMLKQMEARHAKIVKKSEAHRAAAMQRASVEPVRTAL